jgi:hypothetical protein
MYQCAFCGLRSENAPPVSVKGYGDIMLLCSNECLGKWNLRAKAVEKGIETLAADRFYHHCDSSLLHEGPHVAADGTPNRATAAEAVDHPAHYNVHPSGVECITIVEHMTFNAGSAVKYVWRSGLKTPDPVEDLKKAAWYIQREIERLERKPK